MVLPVVALPLAALRCDGSVNKALRGAPAAATPRMALFLAVREDALPGARYAAGQQPTRRGFPGSVPNLIQTGPAWDALTSQIRIPRYAFVGPGGVRVSA